ncbi:MAG: hypothetical protein ABJB04_08450, partial [Betaproteobacteria bacterium]
APREVPAAPPAPPQPEFKPFVLPPESGLVLVETQPPPVQPAEPAASSASARPAAPRRARPPRGAIAEEPLVMVETAHKPDGT